MGDAFIKLLQSPLVAELVAVAATAALAALAEHGFTRGDRQPRQARRQGGQGSRQGCGCGRRPAARHRDRRDPRDREELRTAQKRKPRAPDVALPRSRDVAADRPRRSRLVSTLSQPPGASQPPARTAARPRCRNPAHKADRRRPGRTARTAVGPAPSRGDTRRGPRRRASRRCAGSPPTAVASLLDECGGGRAARQRFEPSAPLPANRSATRRSSKLPRRLASIENNVSRTRSAVGRVAGPAAPRSPARATRRR